MIWCTPAMQAWKASEEKAWLALPKRCVRAGFSPSRLAMKSHPGRIVDRLMERLRAEAGPYFRMVVMARGLCRARAGR